MSKFKLLDKVVIDESEEVLTITEIIFGSHGGYSPWGNSILTRHTKITFDPTVKQNEIQYKMADSEGKTWVRAESAITYISTPKKLVKYDLLKMFVLVKDTAPIGLGINAVGHAAFMAGRNFDSSIFKAW